jgi:hypothetical protein
MDALVPDELVLECGCLAWTPKGVECGSCEHLHCYVADLFARQ